jgi:hypothetical protein
MRARALRGGKAGHGFAARQMVYSSCGWPLRNRSSSASQTSVGQLDHLLAPLYARALFGAPASEAFAEKLVERLMTQG